MDETAKPMTDLAQLSRIALSGRPQDVRAFVLKLSRKYRKIEPEFATRLAELIGKGLSPRSPLRGESMTAIPVDTDTRLQLIRHENPPLLDTPPVLSAEVSRLLDRIVLEHSRSKKLIEAGLSPTRTALFTGPPGVGKTMSARWLADRLERPLLTLDLSAVMSSYLGRTGANVRHVLDYAKGVTCVILLDELDAIAKRRDDSQEVGELKRLVTVLLQEIDDWPSGGLLIAATNHADLMDPAVWRRFEVRVDFPLPTNQDLNAVIGQTLGELTKAEQPWLEILTSIFKGCSFSDVHRELLACQREVLVTGRSLSQCLAELVHRHVDNLRLKEKRVLVVQLSATGMSQRRMREVTGLSRDFIRKWTGTIEADL